MRKILLGFSLLFVSLILIGCNTKPQPTDTDIPVEKFIITFDLGYETDEKIASQEVEKHKKVTEPVNPTRVGYEFIGWSLDGSIYSFNSLVTKDINLVAVWELLKFEVTFIADNKTYKTEQVNYGQKLEKPTDPQKEGFNFLGWYIGEDLYNFNDEVIEDLTLIAKFDSKNVLVTFMSDNKIYGEPVEVLYNTTVTRPVDPVKEGYRFLGWLLDGFAFDFYTPLTESITLEANWTIVPVITGMKNYSLNVSDNKPNFLDGVVATDFIDGELPITVYDSALDLTKPGTYTVILEATNSKGNSTTADIIVEVTYLSRTLVIEDNGYIIKTQQEETLILGFILVIDYEILNNKTKDNINATLGTAFNEWISDINITDTQIIIAATGLEEVNIYQLVTLLQISNTVELNLTINSIEFDYMQFDYPQN